MGAFGIIPARAGFTNCKPCVLEEIGDHPRSRGVYNPRPRTSPVNGGSSPLARGLPADTDWYGAEHRIIPARAGFTCLSCDVVLGEWDHPRSRGVYCNTTVEFRNTPGSSPLARGLPSTVSGASSTYRIIPARAGFTFCLLSSFHRIIPARAGFTTNNLKRQRTLKDHPRSRGVYWHVCLIPWGYRGSSPLARGLQKTTNQRLCRRRIIPARAGFTFDFIIGLIAWSDHPRSRGVYLAGLVVPSRLKGSSPLARGLHTTEELDLTGRRIIPARAGFTDRSA